MWVISQQNCQHFYIPIERKQNLLKVVFVKKEIVFAIARCA